MPMNFQEALNTRAEEIERPALIPVGLYKATVIKVPTMDTIADGRFDVCDFILRLTEPVEGVDEDELRAYGGLTQGSIIRHRFLFNKEDDANFKRTLFHLKTFLRDHLQVDFPDSMPLKQALNESVNSQCIVLIRNRPDKNNADNVYSEVGKTAPIQ